MRRLRLQMMAGGIPLDPDAVAFLTAAGITDATITAAIDTLVVQLKAIGVWTKMKALYPFVGGIASTHKFNLKNPVDSDAAFRLVFNGGVTHSINGVQFNGSNGYADTRLNPTFELSLNSTHLSFYSRTNTPGSSVCDIGALSAGNWTLLEIFGNVIYPLINQNTLSSVAQTNSQSFFLGSRTASNLTKTFWKNTQILSSSTASSNLANLPIFIGAMNSSPIQFYSDRQYALVSIGDGLTDTEAANYYTAVQAFQTTLGRQVV
jgi:hypothetical protein